uniref:Uncharacterized protein n=1 Tax=Meloidogyne enterolobii TaxID=390850 RepID=A0A6V7XPM5_MELEN|nr:unnamed protein product [Meloidogyne enterolobii]
MEPPKYPHIIPSEVKKTNEDSRMQKDDNKLNGLDKITNFDKQTTKQKDKYKLDIQGFSIWMPSPRIIFISTFLCAPFILFTVMIICYYWT